MRSRSSLGNFELMVLLVLMHLGEDAYGVPISRELERHTRRDVALGSVYAALERLEQKGLVSSALGDPTAARGGRAKRYFRVTSAGRREVQATRQIFTTLWQDLPALRGRTA